MPRHDIQPLQVITRVRDTGRRGKEIRPGANLFTKEYILYLACGHEQVRTTSNPRILSDEPGELFPKRTRCKECPVIENTTPPQRPPTHDPLAQELVNTACTDENSEQLDTWLNTHGRWIPYEYMRTHVYATCALAMIDEHIATQDTEGHHFAESQDIESPEFTVIDSD